MSDRFTKIDNGICPECEGKMVWLSDGYRCDECGIKYRFNDDMGPGSYSSKYIEGGRKWKEDKLYTILCDLEYVAHSYYDDNPELWKAYNLIKDELSKVTLSEESKDA